MQAHAPVFFIVEQVARTIGSLFEIWIASHRHVCACSGEFGLEARGALGRSGVYRPRVEEFTML